jgi:hypothetical protein
MPSLASINFESAAWGSNNSSSFTVDAYPPNQALQKPARRPGGVKQRPKLVLVRSRKSSKGGAAPPIQDLLSPVHEQKESVLTNKDAIDISLHIVPPGGCYDSDEEAKFEDDDDDDDDVSYENLNDRFETSRRFMDDNKSSQDSTDTLPSVPIRRSSINTVNEDLNGSGHSFASFSCSPDVMPKASSGEDHLQMSALTVGPFPDLADSLASMKTNDC